MSALAWKRIMGILHGHLLCQGTFTAVRLSGPLTSVPETGRRTFGFSVRHLKDLFLHCRHCILSLFLWQSQDRGESSQVLLGAKQGVGATAAASLPRKCEPQIQELWWRRVALWQGLCSVGRYGRFETYKRRQGGF